MLTADKRQQSDRMLLWLALGCFLLFGFLTFYQFRYGVRLTTDPVLLKDLSGAQILEEPASTATADWPQWRGPRRDGISTATGLLVDWPAGGPPVAWRIAGGSGYSALAVAGGRAFTMWREGDKEVVVCLDAATGKEKWRFPYPCDYGNDQGSGPRSTPTVDGKLLYTVGAKGMFHCLETETGEVRWKHDLVSEFKARVPHWGVSFSPLVDGDLVFTMPGGPDGYSLIAFNKSDGKVQWKGLADPPGYSSPIAIDSEAGGGHQIVCFTGHSLVSVAPGDGKVLWRFPWPTSNDVNAATPIFFRARTGEPGASATGGNPVSDYLFISSNYGKGCALLKVGQPLGLVYQSNQMKNHFSSSVLYHGHLYGFDDAMLVCLDVHTGKPLWKQRGFGKGSLLAADGHLIILGEHGTLAVAEATPEAYHERSRFEAFPGRKTWTVPILADGRLYLRDEQEVLCLDLKKR
jgi:outer membrane protein assembly factor BamB